MNPLSTSPRTALLSVAFFCVSSFSAQALTLQEAYALKGSGQVAAELSLSASGAPKGDARVSALARPGQGGRLLADLNRLGLTHGAQAGRLVTGQLPLSAVSKLAGLASLHSIRPSHALFLAADPGAGRQGSIVSQGDTEMYAAAARTRFQVDGTGVKVGVLSDSFNCGLKGDPYRNTSLAIQTGDVPMDVQVLSDSKCDPLTTWGSVGSDEGRSMLEVIHDLAPGADLVFHSTVNGAADMAQGIRALADAGASVIVDDTIYLEEPVYQDGGPIADAVKDVVARGVAYVAAAGNFGRKTYEAPFRPSGVTLTIPEQVKEWSGLEVLKDANGQPLGNRPFNTRMTTQARTVELHDFDPGPGVDTCQRITLYDAPRIALALHWDQPYASIVGGPGATTDLDLFLMDENCQQVYQAPINPGVPAAQINPANYGMFGVAATDNLDGDPVETLVVADSGTDPVNSAGDILPRTYGIAVGRVTGPAPTRLRITYANGATHSDVAVFAVNSLELQKRATESAEYSQESPGIYGHANLLEVVTVGAVRAKVLRSNTLVQAGGRGYPDEFIDTGFNQTEPFSALGGTTLLFDDHGQPLTQPLRRQKPDVAGLNGTEYMSDIRGATLKRGDWFFGTSAAAAHIGGLLALARQAAPAATPDQIAEALRATAIDLDDTLTPGADTGFDFATGHGLADGENLIAKLLTQPNTAHAGAGTPGIVDCAQPTATLKSGAKYRGTTGSDVAKGAAGKETLNGLQGDDSLCGEAGNDQLLGGPGNDLLVGGPGNDVLTGGPGNDVFRFGVGAGADKIMDFTRGDRIVFVGKADNNGDGIIDFTLEDKPTGTLLRFPNGDTLTLRNVRSKRLAHLPITGSTYTLVFQN